MLRKRGGIKDIPRCLQGGVIALWVPGPDLYLVKNEALFAGIFDLTYLSCSLASTAFYSRGCVLEWDNSLASIFPLSLQVVLRRLARECYDPIISYLYLHEQQKPDYLMFHVMHSCKKENKRGFPGFIGLVLNTLVCVCEIFNETVKECTKKSSLKFKLFSCWHFKP